MKKITNEEKEKKYELTGLTVKHWIRIVKV